MHQEPSGEWIVAYTTIDNPELYFQTKLYTGNGGTLAVTLDGSENMQPDWVWLKNRSSSYFHGLYDSVRGTGTSKSLYSNTADTEGTNSANQNLTSFDSDGFSLGATSGTNAINTNSENHVAWNWKAGTSFSNDASSTGVGTIDSTGSISTTAGFGIISYTGNGSAGASIAHGLGVVPDVLLVKGRSIGDSWTMYHKAIASDPETDMIKLDEDVVPIDSNVFWNDTAPTSSVFTVDGAGGETKVNGSGKTYIAYCFKSIKGFSKFGGYKGNGNADGTFVYTGFKPAWVMVRNISNNARNWTIIDNKRNPFNPEDEWLYPNASDSTFDASSFPTDFVSNGFKIKNTGSYFNTSGENYIYWAFAESPFVNSKGVPNNAR